MTLDEFMGSRFINSYVEEEEWDSLHVCPGVVRPWKAESTSNMLIMINWGFFTILKAGLYPERESYEEDGISLAVVDNAV